MGIWVAKVQFQYYYKSLSKYNNWKSAVANLRLLEMTNTSNDLSYIILINLRFVCPFQYFFMELNQFPKNKLLLILRQESQYGRWFDGSTPFGHKIFAPHWAFCHTRKSGLTIRATANWWICWLCRQLHIQYSMAEAIQNGALCRYYYYPHCSFDWKRNGWIRWTFKKDSQDNGLSRWGEPGTFENAFCSNCKRIIHKAANEAVRFQTRLFSNGWKKRQFEIHFSPYVPERQQAR